MCFVPALRRRRRGYTAIQLMPTKAKLADSSQQPHDFIPLLDSWPTFWIEAPWQLISGSRSEFPQFLPPEAFFPSLTPSG